MERKVFLLRIAAIGQPLFGEAEGEGQREIAARILADYVLGFGRCCICRRYARKSRGFPVRK